MSDQENSVDPSSSSSRDLGENNHKLKNQGNTIVINQEQAFLVIEFEPEDLVDFQKLRVPKVFSEICRRIASGELLQDILDSDKDRFPCNANFYRFCDRHESASRAYHRARVQQMEAWSDQLIIRSKDSSRDVIENEIYDKHGNHLRTERRSDNTAVNRDRLITENMKWLMARVNPEKYSDKHQLELSGSVAVTPIIELNMKGVNISQAPAPPSLPSPFSFANDRPKLEALGDKFVERNERHKANAKARRIKAKARKAKASG